MSSVELKTFNSEHFEESPYPDQSGVGHPPQSRLARNADFSGSETPLRKRRKSCNPYLSRCPEPSEALSRVPRQASKRGLLGGRGAWPGPGAEFLVKMSVWPGLGAEFFVKMNVWPGSAAEFL